MELSPEQVTQFNRDGFLLFPNLFNEEEVDVLRRETDRVSKINSEMVVREGEEEAVKIMFRLHEEDGDGEPVVLSAAQSADGP